MTATPIAETDEEAQRRALQYQGARHLQEDIRHRLGKPGVLQKAMAGGWQRRTDAIRMLGFLGRDDEVLKLALAETDAEIVVDHAVKVLMPAPVELVAHMLQMKHGSASAALRHPIALGNFLHAEAVIVERVGKNAGRLSATTLAAFGLAGLASAAPILRKHLKIDRLRTYAQAVDAGLGAKMKPENLQDPDRQWDGASERAIAALVALRRLGADVDIGFVATLREQARIYVGNNQTRHLARAWEMLTWVLFDSGDRAALETLLALESRFDTAADIGVTLLKNGDTAQLHRYLDVIGRRYLPDTRHFCHWPLADLLRAEGIAMTPGLGADEMYCLSRDVGLAPPSWWQWRTPWETSFATRRIRGRL
jgi:hypothetical protein